MVAPLLDLGIVALMGVAQQILVHRVGAVQHVNVVKTVEVLHAIVKIIPIARSKVSQVVL